MITVIHFAKIINFQNTTENYYQTIHVNYTLKIKKKLWKLIIQSKQVTFYKKQIQL